MLTRTAPIVSRAFKVVTILFCLTDTNAQAPFFSQPPNPAGSFFQSSSNGTDYDQFVWDDFTVQTTTSITEIDWFGVYDPTRSGSGGPVTDFRVSIYASIAGGTQPDVTNPPLVEYLTGGNAGEADSGFLGGVTGYAYHSVLPMPFHANAGTTYWLQIEALQTGIPDWGIAAGTGGDGRHFRRISNGVDFFYQSGVGDGAFSLLGDPATNGQSRRATMSRSDSPLKVRLMRLGPSFELRIPPEMLGSALLVVNACGKTLFSVESLSSTSMTVDLRIPLAGEYVVVTRKDGAWSAGTRGAPSW